MSKKVIVPHPKWKGPDERAYKILKTICWDKGQWRKEKRKPPKEEWEYAKQAGYVFEPVTLSHDESINWVIRTIKKVNPSDIGTSFLASFSSHRLELRSAMPAYCQGYIAKRHKMSSDTYCKVCEGFDTVDMDFTTSNFQRYHWGCGPLFFIAANAFMLERHLIEGFPEPTTEDIRIFAEILKTADHLKPADRARDLEKALKDIFKSNKAQRETLVDNLGIAGILLPEDLSEENFQSVPLKCNWSDVTALWRGGNGVNWEMVKYFFNDYITLLRK